MSNLIEDLIENARLEREKRASFGKQLVEGAIKTGSLGYGGEEAPADLPLSGKIGRFSGEMLGYIPALSLGGASATAVGMTGLAKEVGIGMLYGMAEKPEDAEASIMDRMKKGAETAAMFGVGYGAIKGIGALGKKMFGPDDLDKLLAKGAEGKGPSGEIKFLEDQRFRMPDETQPFNMSDESAFSSRKALPAPREIGSPEDLQRAMEMESALGRETVGQVIPRGEPKRPGISGDFWGEREKFNKGRKSSFGEDMPPKDPSTSSPYLEDFYPKTPIEEATISRQRSMEIEKQIENAISRQRGIEIEKQIEAAISRQRSMDIEKQIEKSRLYEGHVNSWAKDILKQVPPEAEMLEQAGRLAISGDVAEATTKMMTDSVKHAIGKTPKVTDDLVESLIPKTETRAALEETIEAIVLKNETPIEVIQSVTQVAEPINRLMVTGMNFKDAAKLTDALVARAKMPLDETKIAEEVASNITQKLTPQKIPEWAVIKKRSYTPDEVVDLFYNVPIKGPQALKHNLLELQPATGGLHLTENGYSFLKKYNPDGLSGVFPPGIDKQIVGAIRGRGYSNINLSLEQVREAGLKMYSERAIQEGFLRPAMKGGKEIPRMYQLEEKGAGMLAGGVKKHANPLLKEWDIASGLRVARTDLEGQAVLRAENARTELLFKDMWEQTNNLGKKC